MQEFTEETAIYSSCLAEAKKMLYFCVLTIYLHFVTILYKNGATSINTHVNTSWLFAAT